MCVMGGMRYDCVVDADVVGWGWYEGRTVDAMEETWKWPERVAAVSVVVVHWLVYSSSHHVLSSCLVLALVAAVALAVRVPSHSVSALVMVVLVSPPAVVSSPVVPAPVNVSVPVPVPVHVSVLVHVVHVHVSVSWDIVVDFF